MLGTDLDPGIIPRSIDQIFNQVESLASENRRFLIRVSYMELYNEQVSDLLVLEVRKKLKSFHLFEFL